MSAVKFPYHPQMELIGSVGCICTVRPMGLAIQATEQRIGNCTSVSAHGPHLWNDRSIGITPGTSICRLQGLDGRPWIALACNEQPWA